MLPHEQAQQDYEAARQATAALMAKRATVVAKVNAARTEAERWRAASAKAFVEDGPQPPEPPLDQQLSEDGAKLAIAAIDDAIKEAKDNEQTLRGKWQAACVAEAVAQRAEFERQLADAIAAAEDALTKLFVMDQLLASVTEPALGPGALAGGLSTARLLRKTPCDLNGLRVRNRAAAQASDVRLDLLKRLGVQRFPWEK